MHKRKAFVTISIVIVIVAGICLFLLDKRTYSATDVLENADFNAENPTVTIHSINTDKEDIYTKIEIPEETQHELIKAFKNAKFEKTTVSLIDYNYRINIALNTGYAMFLDSDEKLLTISNTKENYAIANDSDFFSILEKATK
ncbi:hypothetical protein FOH38_19175 [Lysinibacillus fusiformis]|nr:hypothetical protein FOH38_19175 [Lysinibacillus fusiformis]